MRAIHDMFSHAGCSKHSCRRTTFDFVTADSDEDYGRTGLRGRAPRPILSDRGLRETVPLFLAPENPATGDGFSTAFFEKGVRNGVKDKCLQRVPRLPTAA